MARKQLKKSGATKGKTAKKKLASTEFTLHAPEAQDVYLAGDFNNWDPQQYSMRKFKNGNCTKKPGL